MDYFKRSADQMHACSHRLEITSDAFASKPQPARHRLVYGLLKDELAAEGGVHALQLRTKTVAEEEKSRGQAPSTAVSE
jgi:BolA protein